MMRYHFIPQEDESLEFFFEASSFDNAVEELVFYLEAHDEWKVKKHSNGEMGVDLFLKNSYIDTLLVSEMPLTKRKK